MPPTPPFLRQLLRNCAARVALRPLSGPSVCRVLRSCAAEAVLLFLLSACQDGLVSNKYCRRPARFTFNPVNSISQLYTSCESQGEWCTVWLQNSKFYFKKANGSQGEANRAAVDGYTGFYMGLSGFIVGLPDIPELGETTCVVTCYDLACRNCYEAYATTRRMTLQEGGLAHCDRCQRTYNLNNTGQVCQGEPGEPLFRYRVYYGNNTLSISNP
ncbi:MAG: hypothetical protein IJ064_01420 [Bacteroidaceae bacterium]|nr:hypothetical protein [Bacteroidaceae bacterium]